MEKEELLLEEYKKAQDSAEHYNQLIWIVTSIFLLGIVSLFSTESCSTLFLRSIISIIAIIFLLGFVEKFNKRKNKKYKRCKEIEKELGEMQQHRNTEEDKGFSLLRTFLLVILCFLFLLAGLLIQPLAMRCLF